LRDSATDDPKDTAMIDLLDPQIILNFSRSHKRGAAFLVLENAEFAFLGAEHIADGRPEPYEYITTTEGTKARILLTQDIIRNGARFPGALGSDGSLLPEAAAAMAEAVNREAGFLVAVAIAEAHGMGEQAARDAAQAQASALRRAAAVAQVVELCGGNQTEAARRLGLDQSTVNKLVRKARAAAGEPTRQDVHHTDGDPRNNDPANLELRDAPTTEGG
jgi:HNH endonuclease/Helix-turn-helix domain